MFRELLVLPGHLFLGVGLNGQAGANQFFMTQDHYPPVKSGKQRKRYVSFVGASYEISYFSGSEVSQFKPDWNI